MCVAVALIATFPGRQISAQESVIQTLDNAQNQFASGTFQRTALTTDLSSVSSNPADERGAVQLAPIGALRPWELVTTPLPNVLADAGVATIGDRLYAVAGTGPNGATDAVLWAKFDQITGGIVPHAQPTDPGYTIVNSSWVNDPLLAAPITPGCSTPMSTRTRSAVGALTTGAGTGFIYVVGGVSPDSLACSANGVELTASGVQIGQIFADGDIEWRTSTQLPSDATAGFTVPRGVEQASATVVRTSSGKAFLYVIGGLSSYENIVESFSSAEKSVYYAEINTATGDLGPWKRDVVAGTQTPENVPLAAGAVGIYDHSAAHVTSTTTTQAGSTITDGIVIAGGFTQAGDLGPNPFVYRATINPADGDLTWDATPSTDNSQVPLGASGQTGIAGLAYNNKLYMIGGRTTTSLDTVLTASFNDELNINPIPGFETQYFIGGGPNNSVLGGNPRTDSGAALMDALPPANNPTDTSLGTAWALVVGGNNAAGGPTDTIFRGRIGGDEAIENSARLVDGWYYSRPFDVTFDQGGGVNRNARVLSIRWAAEINRTASGNANADMIVEFRKTLRADPNCPDDSVFGPNDTWRTLDGDAGSAFYSKSTSAGEPFNTVTLKDVFGSEDFVATCFQYRVRFLQNGLDAQGLPVAPQTATASPKLLSMNIEKVVAGNADIRVLEFDRSIIGGGLATLDMKIQNLSLEGRENTQDAGLNDNDGGFFVHLCVAYAAQGDPVLTLPTLPVDPNGPRPDCFKAYYQVYKWQMRAGSQLALVNSGDQTWKRQTSATTEEAIPDIRTLFSEPGKYKVAMVIDAFNFVNEGTSGELNNIGQEAANGNTPQILELTITAPPGNYVYLPAVRR